MGRRGTSLSEGRRPSRSPPTASSMSGAGTTAPPTAPSTVRGGSSCRGSSTSIRTRTPSRRARGCARTTGSPRCTTPGSTSAPAPSPSTSPAARPRWRWPTPSCSCPASPPGGPLEPDRGVARPGRPERPSGLRRLVLRRRVLEARAPARARLRLGRGAGEARVRGLHPDHGPRRAAPERASSRHRLPGPDRDLHRVDPPRRGRPRPRDRPPPHHPPLAVEARVPRDRAPPREDPARVRRGDRLPRPRHGPRARHLHRRAPGHPLAHRRRPRPPRRLRDHRRPLPLPLRPLRARDGPLRPLPGARG